MSFKLTILGSSSALPTSERFPTAHLLSIDERFFLIDCGEGTQIQLRKYRVNFGKIDHIFISHLHGDHTFGLYGLISSFSLQGRQADLHIYAYKDLKKVLDNHMEYYAKNLPFSIVFHPVTASKNKVIFENSKLTVETIPLKHRVPTCGFLFREKKKLRNINKEFIEKYKIPIHEIVKIKEGADFISSSGEAIKNQILTTPPPKPRSYAYCSDTRIYEKILDVIKNTDLLYHEATFLEKDAALAKQTLHSTAKQAAIIAHKANVGKLLIGHYSSRYKDTDEFANEAKTVFENTVAVNDGDVFEVPLSPSISEEDL